MDKILVTGGTGLIGTYLKKILPDAKYVSSKDYNLLDLTEVKKRMKEETPRTNFLAKGKLSMLRKHLHKKQILKELKDRPEHLSPAKVKSD